MIHVKHKGSFSKTEEFFNRVLRRDYLNVIGKYGERGVAALRSATPTKTGGVANAWEYLIEEKQPGVITLSFINNKENDGMNIVLLLIYGHGTNNGGYVVGNDFVHPALRPIFQEMADGMWKEVTR